MLLALWTAASSNVEVVEVLAAQEVAVVAVPHLPKEGLLLQGLQHRVNLVRQSHL